LESRGQERPYEQSKSKGGSMRYATATAAPRSSIRLLLVVYLVAGGIVAATHHYWSNPDTVKRVISALLATVLWPLLLLGISLHIR